MRRVLLAVCAVALLGVAAVAALGSDTSRGPSVNRAEPAAGAADGASDSAPFAIAASRQERGSASGEGDADVARARAALALHRARRTQRSPQAPRGGALRDAVVAEIATRMNTTPDRIETALVVARAKALGRAARRHAITPAERTALARCAQDGTRCSDPAFRRAMRRLRTHTPRTAWDDRAQELFDDLASALDRPSRDVVQTLRAELSQKLGMAAAVGMISARERSAALACFDTPNRCDVALVRRALGR